MAETSIMTTVTIATFTLNIFFNITVISIILLSHQLRKKPRHILKLSISLLDLMVGCIHISILVSNSGQLCHQAQALQVISEFLGYFIVGWTMVTLNIMTISKSFQDVGLFHYCVDLLTEMHIEAKLLCAWPWPAAISFLLPLLLTSEAQTEFSHVDEVLCFTHLAEPVLIIVSCVTLHLPCYFSLAYLVTVLSCRRFNTSQTHDVIEDQSARPAHGTDESGYCQVTVPAVTYFICHLPLVIYTWIWFIHRWLPNEFFSSLVTTFVMSRSFLQPLSWMVCNDLREEARNVYRLMISQVYRCSMHKVTTTATSMSYNILQEFQPL